MLGLSDTFTTYVHIYMHNVCCNSEQWMIYSQEQQYRDKVIRDLQEMKCELLICNHICIMNIKTFKSLRMSHLSPLQPGTQPSSQTPSNLSQLGMQSGPHSCEQFTPYQPGGHAVG